MHRLLYFSRMSLARNNVNLKKLLLLEKENYCVTYFSSYGDVPDNGINSTKFINIEQKVKLIRQNGFLSKVINYLIFSWIIFKNSLRESPAVLVLHDSVHLPIAVVLKWLIGCRIVIDFHEIIWDCGYSYGISKIYGFIEYRCASSIDLAIFPSAKRCEIIKSHTPILCPTVIFPNLPLPNEVNSPEVEKSIVIKFIYFGSVNRANIKSLRLILRKIIKSGFEVDIYPIGEFSANPRQIFNSELITYFPAFDFNEISKILPKYHASICSYDLTCLNNRYCAPRKIYDSLYYGLPVITNDLISLKNDHLVSKYIINVDKHMCLTREMIPIISLENLNSIRVSFHNELAKAEHSLLQNIYQVVSIK